MSVIPRGEQFQIASHSAAQNFHAWAGTLNPALRGTDISSARYHGAGPFLVRAYHGTTHGFDVFDASVKGFRGGAFGRLHYFTSDLDDALQNYACEGPDLKNRIENEAEQLFYKIEERPLDYGLSENCSDEDLRKKSSEVARASLMGNQPRVLDVYLRFDRPFVVRGRTAKDRDTTPQLFPECEDYFAIAENEVLRENGITADPGSDAYQEAVDEFEDDIYTKHDELRDAVADRLTDAFVAAADALDIDAPEVPGDIFSDIEGLTHDRFYKLLEEDSDLSSIECHETGELIRDEFISGVIMRLGFDAIVLLDASLHFAGMTIAPGTAHIHIFDSHRSRIKSVQNEGQFSAADDNIYR